MNPDLRNILERDFSDRVPPQRIVTIENFLAIDTIRSGAQGPGYEVLTNESFDFEELPDLPSELTALRQRWGWDQICNEIDRLKMVDEFLTSDGSIHFVTSGRLSTEKNQQLIIRAFAQVYDQYPDVRLIIVGDGPLRNELTNLSHALNLSHAVSFAGSLVNPFPIIANSDCFLFSSMYEGQGLALMEALVLGLPVISTEYDVIRSVLPPESGIITDPDVESFSRAMIDFVEGRVSTQNFDAEGYNLRALDSFNTFVAKAHTVVG